MPFKKKLLVGPRFVTWSTRNLLESHRDRMRVLATLRDHRGNRMSMEAVLNEALGVGLDKMEEEFPGLVKRKKEQRA